MLALIRTAIACLFSLPGLFTMICFASTAAAQEFPVPEGAVVDITKAPYAAKGDGVTDDTDAFRRALADKVRLIYVPKGTYLVSSTLEWGARQNRQTLQGQSAEGTVIKLKDGAAGFDDPQNPKAVIWTGNKPAQRFRNSIRDLTVSVGSGNAGAIGIQFNASNQGGMENTTIRSEDENGIIGLDLGYTSEQGPCFIKNIKVYGFDVGVSTKHVGNGVTLEYLTLENQRKVGFRNQGQCVAVRGIKSRNAVPAYDNGGGTGHTAIIDCEFVGVGEASNAPAIMNGSSMFARNIKTSGYKQAISSERTPSDGVLDANVVEWTSHPVLSLFPSPARSLNLPIKETPQIPYTIDRGCASLADFSKHVKEIVLNGKAKKTLADWGPALQAAIDSGATTVYIPANISVGIFSDVHVRGKVERIIGYDNGFNKPPAPTNTGSEPTPDSEYFPTLIVDDGEAPVVIIEHLDSSYTGMSFAQRSRRTLVLRRLFARDVTVNEGAGDVFIEDIVGQRLTLAKGTHVWARQVDIENWHEPKTLNDGGDLWILGIKSETDATFHKVTGGGRTEFIGGFIYANKNLISPKQMFICDDKSSISFSVGEWVIRKAPFDVISETRGGETRRLLHGQAYPRGEGSSVPLYTGYSGDPMPGSQPNPEKAK